MTTMLTLDLDNVKSFREAYQVLEENTFEILKYSTLGHFYLPFAGYDKDKDSIMFLCACLAGLGWKMNDNKTRQNLLHK